MKASKFPQAPILIVDDEKKSLESLEVTLFTSGLTHVELCHDSREVMAILEKKTVSLILLDIIMPYIRGDQLLSEIKSNYPGIPVIITTAVEEVEMAVNCIRKGAFDYVLKPIETERLVNSIHRVLEYEELEIENKNLRKLILNGGIKHPKAFQPIITQNAKMVSIFGYCEAIATTNRPILITGETGTGKELIARAIHTLSQKKGAFIAVNASGFDDLLFADNLFGHTKGAFTSATESRKGMIELAQNGTLFLDEIGDLSINSQLKLLRLLQEREYLALGSDVVRISNARVLVATNANLLESQKKGTFRKDLYYRLSHRIDLPPLRERKEDIGLLLEYFLTRETKALKKSAMTYEAPVIDLLKAYDFPGNIRELEAIVGDVVAVNRSHKLTHQLFQKYLGTMYENFSHLSSSIEDTDTENLVLKSVDDLKTYKEATKQFQKQWVLEAMRRAQNNQSAAARLLGISQQALNKKLKSF